MAKKGNNLKCDKCGQEFATTELADEHKNKAFLFDDKVFCENCLVRVGGDPNTAQVLLNLKHAQNKTKQHDW